MIKLKRQRLVYFLTGITAAITLPVTIFILSVGLVSFDKSYYYKEYEKYHVGIEQSLSKSDLKLITERVTGYLSGSSPDLNFVVERDKSIGKDYFSDRDKAHMVDVKNIFTQLKVIGAISAALLAISLFVILREPRYKENIHRFLGTGAIAGIIPFLVLGILMLWDFNKYFIAFHERFFTNDLWLLDPAVDNLVNIFPEGFFMDMGLRICGGYIIGLLAVIVLSLSTISKIRRDLK